jgi:hypothetical protein
MGLLNVSPLREGMPSIKAGKNPMEYHASDMRYLISKANEDEEAIELLENFIGEDNIWDLLSIFGIDTGLNEISTAGGAAASVEGSPGKKPGKRDKEKETLIRENIDLGLVDDVIRLIMKRGIMQ